MNPRPFTTRTAQRTAKGLAVTALAVGLVATVLVPSAAQAAPPINPRPGPSYAPDLTAVFKQGDPHTRLSLTYFHVIVKNLGSSDANAIRVNVTVPSGFTDLKVLGANPGTCSVAGWTATCALIQLIGGTEHLINMSAISGVETGAHEVTVTVDPDGLVKESDETNNTVTGTIIVY